MLDSTPDTQSRISSSTRSRPPTAEVFGLGTKIASSAGLSAAPLYIRARRSWRESGRFAMDAGANLMKLPTIPTSLSPRARARILMRATSSRFTTAAGGWP